MFACRTHTLRFYIRDHKHFHDCGNGFHLFHWPFAGHCARILAAGTQWWPAYPDFSRNRRLAVSGLAGVQSGGRYRRRHGHFSGALHQDGTAWHFLYDDLHVAGGVRVLRERIMIRSLGVLAILVALGALKLPIERDLAALHRHEHFRGVEFNLDLREKLGQLGFIAALSGFRAIVADALFIQAHVAWERTEWGRILLLFRHITTLQPRVLLFWDTAAWHMAWNASVAAMNDRTQPRLALRVKAQREYFALGKDFLEHGIQNNPDRPQLYEALARLYKEKYKDHERAAEFYAKAAALPDAATFDRRFSAYELSYCEGREREAYERLRGLYDEGEQERLPTLIARLKFLEDKLTIPQDQRIPDKGPVGR